MTTFTVARQGDRKKNPDMVTVRPMTRDEILALGYGDHPAVILRSGKLGAVKINGAIRTWKRDPERIEVPLKYGMYEYATFDMRESLERFVVEVQS